MRIGVVALQGAFAEHERVLSDLGATPVEVRQRRDMDDGLDGIIIPGGESTVMTKLLYGLDLIDPLRRAIDGGVPVFGTCAGMILLARGVEGGVPGCLPILDVVVRRNAFGRQLGSFRTEGAFRGIGPVPMVFIRAPFVVDAGPDVEVLATVRHGRAVSSACPATALGAGTVATPGGAASRGEAPSADEDRVVAVRQGSVLATAFHPELTGDARVHRYFLERLCAAR